MFFSAENGGSEKDLAQFGTGTTQPCLDRPMCFCPLHPPSSTMVTFRSFSISSPDLHQSLRLWDLGSGLHHGCHTSAKGDAHEIRWPGGPGDPFTDKGLKTSTKTSIYNRNFGDRGISYGKWGSKELRLWVSQPRDSHLQQIHIHVNPGVITPLFIKGWAPILMVIYQDLGVSPGLILCFG